MICSLYSPRRRRERHQVLRRHLDSHPVNGYGSFINSPCPLPPLPLSLPLSTPFFPTLGITSSNFPTGTLCGSSNKSSDSTPVLAGAGTLLPSDASRPFSFCPAPHYPPKGFTVKQNSYASHTRTRVPSFQPHCSTLAQLLYTDIVFSASSSSQRYHGLHSPVHPCPLSAHRPILHTRMDGMTRISMSFHCYGRLLTSYTTGRGPFTPSTPRWQ
jgi:hypothetical protein